MTPKPVSTAPTPVAWIVDGPGDYHWAVFRQDRIESSVHTNSNLDQWVDPTDFTASAVYDVSESVDWVTLTDADRQTHPHPGIQSTMIVRLELTDGRVVYGYYHASTGRFDTPVGAQVLADVVRYAPVETTMKLLD